MTISKEFIRQLFLALTLFSILFLASCEKDDNPFTEIVSSEAATFFNVGYGKDALQTMDIYLPVNRSRQSTRVMILIHGGGWFQGNKEEMDVFVEELQRQAGNEFALVNINYRLVNPLGPRYMLPTQMDDIESAIDYIENHSSSLGVKPQFVTMGVSAGGHLAMLHAYKYDVKSRVQSVINIVGPSDLTDSFYSSDPLFALGMRYISNSKNVPDGYSATEYASPITWVSSKSQPTISFYGESDHLIPETQRLILQEKLDGFGVRNETYVYDSGHLFFEKLKGVVAEVVSKSLEFVR